jgi:uncharacterized membrane protein YtjA (UPF0391 family)
MRERPHPMPRPGAPPKLCRQSDVAARSTQGYAVVFFVTGLIAALFGFGGIAAGAAGIANILFVLLLALALVAFANLVRR